QTGHAVNVYVGPESEIYAVMLDPRGQPFVSKGDLRIADLPPVEILPQIGPLPHEERLLDSDYVRRAMSSDLASLHFRNELFLFPDERRQFTQLAESTWHGIRVQELTWSRRRGETLLSLLIRDGDFVAEIAWMGHGLQMWLQAMWFLTRVSDDAV